MSIKLIGTSWCAPCKVVKQKLDQAGVDYDYLDGDTDEGMAEAQAAGARSFPILWIGSDIYIGQDAVEVVQAI